MLTFGSKPNKTGREEQLPLAEVADSLCGHTIHPRSAGLPHPKVDAGDCVSLMGGSGGSNIPTADMLTLTEVDPRAKGGIDIDYNSEVLIPDTAR